MERGSTNKTVRRLSIEAGLVSVVAVSNDAPTRCQVLD